MGPRVSFCINSTTWCLLFVLVLTWCLLFVLVLTFSINYWGERRLLLSWAKAGKDSKGRNKATRSEGIVLHARSRAMRGCYREDVVGKVKGVEEVGV